MMALCDQYSHAERDDIEEIRLRVRKPVEVILRHQTFPLIFDGGNVVFTEGHAEQVMGQLSNHSLYSLEEELKRGYVTVKGGHRVGICGQAVISDGRVQHLHHIGSFNIRIARERWHCATSVLPLIYEKGNSLNTLIIGRPQAGKTTLLRELARLFSNGDPAAFRPAFKVGIIDERSEIAGCYLGIPQNDVGERTDVLDACPKAEGMMMMIRSMSPDIIIVDELGRKEDVEAIFEAINAGVQVIATVHGHDLEQLLKRPGIQTLLKAHVFDRYIELNRISSNKRSVGVRHTIRDTHGRLIKNIEVI